jgi:uncharacterized membrane protein (DUF485 family)
MTQKIPSKTSSAPEQANSAEPSEIHWQGIAATPEFKSLLKAKVRFIFAASAFFMVYYFALPLLVGYAPNLMARKIRGVINVAYVFALSQFVMAWMVAALYVRVAGRFDRRAKEIIALARDRRMLGGK